MNNNGQEKNSKANNIFREMVKYVCENYFNGNGNLMASEVGTSQPTIWRLIDGKTDDPKRPTRNKIKDFVLQQYKKGVIDLPNKFKVLFPELGAPYIPDKYTFSQEAVKKYGPIIQRIVMNVNSAADDEDDEMVIMVLKWAVIKLEKKPKKKSVEKKV